MYLTAGLCKQRENTICTMKIPYFLLFPDPQTDPKYFCLPPKSQWNTKFKTNFISVDLPFFEQVPAGRDQRGLWSVLLCKLRSWLRAHHVCSDPPPEEPLAMSGYPEQCLPRSMRLHPWLLTGPEQADPGRKAKHLVLWAAPHGTAWTLYNANTSHDFCQHLAKCFTWPWVAWHFFSSAALVCQPLLHCG